MTSIVIVDADDLELAYILTVAHVVAIEKRQMTEYEREINMHNYTFENADAAMTWIECHARVGWSTRIISDD